MGSIRIVRARFSRHRVPRLLSLAAFVAVFAWTELALADTSLLVVTDAGSWETLVRANAETVASEQRFELIHLSELEGSELSLTSIARCARTRTCKEDEMQGVAERIVVLAVEGDSADGSRIIITGWFLDGDTGKTLRTERRVCPGCGMGEALAAKVSELVRSLLEWERLNAPGDTMLQVTTVPEGADVVIDGSIVARSGDVFATAAGTISVSCKKDGYEVATRKVQIVRDQTTRITVVLTETTDNARLWAYAALAGGVGALSLGATWIAIDGPRFDDGGRLANRRDTMVPGIIATGVGVALVTTGVLLWRRSSGETKSTTITTVALPTAGGAALGLTGTF